MLRKLGALEDVRSCTTGEAGVQWVNSANRILATIDAAPGGPTAEIEVLRGSLAEILVRKAECISDHVQKDGGHGIRWIYGDHLSSISQSSEGIDVTFAKSGRTETFDLLIGADGLQSSTRKIIWPPHENATCLHRTGVYAGFFSLPVEGTDSAYRRWWHSPGTKGIMLRPDTVNHRTTALMHVMPLPDDNRFEAAAIGSSGIATQKALLTESFRASGWETPRILRELSSAKDFYYDMIAQVKLDSYHIQRVALLGDAAYCASPVSGMGTTLALSGAYTLAGMILRHGRDYETAFLGYEERMKPMVRKAQKLKPGVLTLLFGVRSAWGVWLLERTVGVLALIVPVVKRLFRGKKAEAEEVLLEDFGIEDWRS